MPEKKTLQRARRDQRQGKSPSTQAGEFIKETIDHIRQGKHGARSTKQAIAIGLSKARRAGVKLPPPKPGKASEGTIEHAKRDLAEGKKPNYKPNPRRSKATTKALQREGRSAVSQSALSRQAAAVANRRTAADKSNSARKAAKTRLAHQTHAERSAIAKKAARTRKKKK